MGRGEPHCRPKDYRETFTRIRVSDRPDTQSTVAIYAKTPGATVNPGERRPYPYESILINEDWTTVKEANGEVVEDEGGRYKTPRRVPPPVRYRKSRLGLRTV